MVGDLAVGGDRGVYSARVCPDVQGVPSVPQARKAAEIESGFGVRLVPRWTSSTRRAMWPTTRRPSTAPPTPEGLEEFFAFLKVGSRRPASLRPPPGTMPCSARSITPGCGPRRQPAGASDLHFGRGPFGKLHVRFGKGARRRSTAPVGADA